MRIIGRWAARALPVIISAALGVAVTAGPASASAGHQWNQDLAVQVCTTNTYNGHNQCLNLWNNNQASGAPIKYYHVNPYEANTENNWLSVVQGSVVGSNCGQPGQPNCWPFVTGSGYNSRYNNDPVYTFSYLANETMCIDQSAYNPGSDIGNLEIEPCGLSSAPSSQLFVYTGSGFLVGAYATNRGYQYGYRNYPVWVASVNGDWLDGAQAVMSNANANAFTFFPG